MIDIVATFVNMLANVLFFAILIRAIMSWVMPQDTSGFSRVLVEITEPIIAPIRRILPSMGGLDLSPMVAMILIQVGSQVLLRVLVTTPG